MTSLTRKMLAVIEWIETIGGLLPFYVYLIIFACLIYVYFEVDKYSGFQKRIKRAFIICLLIPIVAWGGLYLTLFIDQSKNTTHYNLFLWAFDAFANVWQLFAPFFALSGIYILISEHLRSVSSKPNNDPWLPQNYYPQQSYKMQLAMSADLENDDIDTIITDLETGINVMHNQRKAVERQLKLWQSVPRASDAEFYGDLPPNQRSHISGRTAQDHAMNWPKSNNNLSISCKWSITTYKRRTNVITK